MTIQRLHHVQFTIPSDQVNEARTFYLDVLGLTEVPKPHSLISRGGFWIELGDFEIHVSLQDDFDRYQTKNHLALQVDHLAEWRNRLTAHGIQIEASVPIPNYDRFEFRDPFGNRVELIQPLNAD